MENYCENVENFGATDWRQELRKDLFFFQRERFSSFENFMTDYIYTLWTKNLESFSSGYIESVTNSVKYIQN